MLLCAVLASNFGGITGGLLSLDGGKLAGRLKVDALFPVAGYKRCLDTQNGYGEALTTFFTHTIRFYALEVPCVDTF